MARLTFEVGCSYGGHGRGGGLGEAVEGGLFAGGLVRGAILLFVSVIKHPHGLQGELLSVAEADTQHYTECSPLSKRFGHTHLTWPAPGMTLIPRNLCTPGAATWIQALFRTLGLG